jgi:glutaredoxin-like protein NrdH
LPPLIRRFLFHFRFIERLSADNRTIPCVQFPEYEEAMSITVYSKPACVQCTATTRALDRQGIDYTIIDVSQDADAFAFVQDLGYRQVPVVIAGKQHWAGFRPDMISGLT